jgi:hypothetical protein
MKYLNSFNESNRFTHFKEVLDNIEDLSLDFTDEGGEVIFGIMPSHDIHYANFDQNLDDISIKMASMGKRSIYVKFDVESIKKASYGSLGESSLELLIDTITSVHNYLLSEDIVVQKFWTKEIVARKRSDYGKNEFFSYKTIDELLNSVDVVRAEKLGQMVSSAGIKMKTDDISFRSLLDVRIVFTGQPLLEESIQISESDVDDVRDIISDFNSEYTDDGKYHIKADAMYAIKRMQISSKFKQSKKCYVIVIADKTTSYDGFQFHESIPLILRLMSKFEIDSIELGILHIHRPSRNFKTFTREELESMSSGNYVMDTISNISISLEI